MRFRTKVFVSAVIASTVSLLVIALLLSMQVRQRQRVLIGERLHDEAQLIADLLAAAPGLERSAMDREADQLGKYSASRVTLIAEDGTVVGDSTQTEEQLKTLENHATRPEVIAARHTGFGPGGPGPRPWAWLGAAATRTVPGSDEPRTTPSERRMP